MKMIKTAILGASALALAGAMNAETIKVTGSSAYRKATYAAIVDQLGGTNNVTAAYIGSDLASANQAIFANAAGTDFVICCMAGSVGGIQWVVNGEDVKTGISSTDVPERAWLKTSLPRSAVTLDTTNKTVTGGALVSSKNATAPAASFDLAGPADVAMSDSQIGATPFAGLAGNVTNIGDGLGLVTFTFAKGQQHPSVTTTQYNGLTNMTTLQFRSLATAGYLPLSFFTGVAADSAVDVVLVGRDSDSGTRLGTFAESGLGGVTQSSLSFRAYSAANVDAGITAGTTISKLVYAGVDPVTEEEVTDPTTAGYSSGGHVKNVLLSTIGASAVSSNGKPFILVGYAGTSDTVTSGSPQTPLLTWNGNAFTADKVKTGNYSFWTVQQMYATNATASSTILSGVAAKIKATYAVWAKGVLMSDLTAISRAGEGTVIDPQ